MSNLKNTLIRSAGVAALALLATSSIASAATITVQDVTAQGTLTPLSPAAGTFPLLALGSTGSAGQHGQVTTTDFSVGGISIDFAGGGTGGGTATGEYYGTNETPYASPFGSNSNANFLVAGAENSGGQHAGVITLTYSTAQSSLSLLWGTIDFDPTSQNVITINTTGGAVTITGVDINNQVGGTLGNGQDDAYVTISNLPGTFTSVTLADNSSTNAFEFVPGAGTPVPEPLTLSLFGAGLAGAAMIRRRKAKKA